jgi:hypothetical protein
MCLAAREYPCAPLVPAPAVQAKRTIALKISTKIVDVRVFVILFSFSIGNHQLTLPAQKQRNRQRSSVNRMHPPFRFYFRPADAARFGVSAGLPEGFTALIFSALKFPALTLQRHLQKIPQESALQPNPGCPVAWKKGAKGLCSALGIREWTDSSWTVNIPGGVLAAN